MIKILHIGCCATGYPLNGFQKALMKLGQYDEVYTGHPDLINSVIQKSNSFKPDLVFIQVQRENIITYQLVEHLKSNGAFVMNWTGDVRTPTPQWYLDFGRHIDLTMFSNMVDVGMLKSKGIASEYLDIGYDPEIYTPTGEKLYNIPEIVYPANNYNQFPLSEYRQEMIKILRVTFGNKFGIYGNGWNLSNGSFMGNQTGEASLYRSCKIAINLSNFQYQRYSSDRMLRIMGSGAFCLSHRYPDIEIDYEHGKDLIIWEDFNDLIDKISYFLKNEKQRYEIARQGHETVLKSHTFDCMAKNIKKLYLKYKNKKA